MSQVKRTSYTLDGAITLAFSTGAFSHTPERLYNILKGFIELKINVAKVGADEKTIKILHDLLNELTTRNEI